MRWVDRLNTRRPNAPRPGSSSQDGWVAKQTDVAVLGSGPAAWAAAAALAPTGVRVTLIAPDPDQLWTNTYGSWVDQIDASVLALVRGTDVWAQVFDTVQVIGERHQLAGRAYGRFDNATLASALRATANTGALNVRGASATRVSHDSTGSTIELNKGASVRAALVLDATGATSPFITREDRAQPAAFQVAYGIIAGFTRPPLSENTCTLMDWRGPDRSVPSFAYTLPIDGRWLVEETVLASRPGVGFDELERRLHDRLRADGLVPTEIQTVERVSFPMDVPLPHRTQRTVGLGAAASLVHPATGYSVAASLRSAPRIAATIAEHLGAGSVDLDRLAHAAWRTFTL